MLLWINVVTDGIPAIALGLDPAERGIMRHKPQVFKTQIISKRLWVEMIIFGILLTIAVLGVYVLNLPKGLQAAQSVAFVALVVFELVNIYIIRSDYKTDFFSNKWLFISIAMTIALQLVIMYVPFLANIFGIIQINLTDWLIIIALSVLLWVVFSLLKKLIYSTHLVKNQ
jgi:Ca2+-transporting ATPase